MKLGIILVSMLISLSCSAEWAAGAGAHCANLSQQWCKIEVWQKNQQKRWTAIERDAERMLKGMHSNEVVSKTKPRCRRY